MRDHAFRPVSAAALEHLLAGAAGDVGDAKVLAMNDVVTGTGDTGQGRVWTCFAEATTVPNDAVAIIMATSSSSADFTVSRMCC